MAVTLKKGQGVSLKKAENDLSQVTIGLGWDIAERKSGGILGGIFGKKQPENEEYDLDVVAFLCGANGKVNDIGTQEENRGPIGGDIIFFNSMQHPTGQVWLTGDNCSGAGEGDDEQIIANLNSLPERYHRIVFVVQIYDGIQKHQSFGQVKNAYIRAVDAKNREMARFDLSGDASYANCRSMIFAELERETAGWKLRAIGTPFEKDSFGYILTQYYL
ncbi:TerD family protein [uncultured Lamprocystis sp.]|jgi:stress response protein SCP2|uniref:TerD family protein n=1 Tax=uncultured Lamprocystis sp. TaxID=543132 RepID=UPI0025E79D67|nr:TerD family protein [uncultured Lamprocystis sp.]